MPLPNVLVVLSDQTRNLEYKRSPHDASIRILRTPTHTYAVRTPTRNPLAGHRRPNAERYVETHCYDNVRDPDQLTNLAGMQETADLRRDPRPSLLGFARSRWSRPASLRNEPGRLRG